MSYDFMIIDVFTEQAFGGNQLAVLIDARGLSDEAMQAVTREFNFAESTFVLPAREPGHTRHVRIFTPGGELPFAGHPTIGTACALVMAGICSAGELTLEEGVGPVSVVTQRDGNVYSATLRLDRAPERSDEVPTAEAAASVLSLRREEILQVFCAGLGPRFTFVQVGSPETVDRAQLDHQQWRSLIAGSWGTQVYVFAGDLSDGSRVHSRMFAPGLGIAEDPATGSAAAALVGVAAERSSGGVSLDIAQGIAMGRPSYLRAQASVDAGQIISIQVGGSCVLVAKGKIDVPDN